GRATPTPTPPARSGSTTTATRTSGRRAARSRSTRRWPSRRTARPCTSRRPASMARAGRSATPPCTRSSRKLHLAGRSPSPESGTAPGPNPVMLTDRAMSTNGGRATLVLEDGVVFEGRSFGATGETTGEVVFNTALCGYQEVLTDPSYAGQIVTMTYPHIGNYGVNRDDVESARPQVAGFVVREASVVASSWRASGELHRYLDESGVVGI